MNSIAPLTLASLVQRHSGILLVDVRSEAEYQRVHVPGARLLPLHRISSDAVRALTDGGHDTVYILCEHGHRARLALEKLEHEGCHGAVLVEGGIHAWIGEGLPVLRGPAAHTLSGRSLLALEAAFLIAGSALGWSVHYGFGLLFAGLGLGLGTLHGWHLPALPHRRRPARS
jgi:rhodanese-related sulfurtransferase